MWTKMMKDVESKEILRYANAAAMNKLTTLMCSYKVQGEPDNIINLAPLASLAMPSNASPNVYAALYNFCIYNREEDI